MKKKLKDLTLGKIVKLAKKHRQNCVECPLYNTSFRCYEFCDCDEETRKEIEKYLNEEEIEV